MMRTIVGRLYILWLPLIFIIYLLFYRTSDIQDPGVPFARQVTMNAALVSPSLAGNWPSLTCSILGMAKVRSTQPGHPLHVTC